MKDLPCSLCLENMTMLLWNVYWNYKTNFKCLFFIWLTNFTNMLRLIHDLHPLGWKKQLLIRNGGVVGKYMIHYCYYLHPIDEPVTSEQNTHLLIFYNFNILFEPKHNTNVFVFSLFKDINNWQNFQLKFQVHIEHAKFIIMSTIVFSTQFLKLHCTKELHVKGTKKKPNHCTKKFLL